MRLTSVMLGWWRVAEGPIIWVLPNLGMGNHTLAATLDSV
jgi:hypothetical protein